MTVTRIHTLPLHLANQIAAGEVIERPASVVKELVENSIDADASQIEINIEGAGSHLIQIQDNGTGIHPDDLIIALSRHATSKIHSSEQLSQINSLGFRGEALPSIASISRLTLTSRPADNDLAYKIAGDENVPSPASLPFGTRLEIRDLFFNVPARRHFLRSNKTEQNHIHTTIQRLALSQFKVGFQYKVANVSKLKVDIANTFEQQQQRVAKICGNNFINSSVYIDQQYQDIELKGWLGKADAHRPQTDVQYFFINGRVIRDRVINHAVRQAYGDSIPTGRQPAFVLYLTIPLDKVDINVHPTKHEVRFRNARLIHGLIISAIQEALSSKQAKLAVTPTKPFHIAEKTVPYDTSLYVDMDTDLGQALTVLEHRYLISQTAQGLLLIDLQLAEQQRCQQQLLDAIQHSNLRSRPILVPLAITATPRQITAVQEHKALLEQLAIQCHIKGQGLAVTAIPSLLTHVDINKFMSAILAEIIHENTNKDRLIKLLQHHIAFISIDNIDHAKQLLAQLNNVAITRKWCIPLDQQTLSSLFST